MQTQWGKKVRIWAESTRDYASRAWRRVDHISWCVRIASDRSSHPVHDKRFKMKLEGHFINRFSNGPSDCVVFNPVDHGQENPFHKQMLFCLLQSKLQPVIECEDRAVRMTPPSL